MASNSDADFPTIIGPDAVFKGELRFDKGVKHLGQFEGQIESSGHLVVAQGAKLSGDVQAGSIDIEGNVKGNLNASDKIRLSSTARLEGDLHTAKLEVKEGAVFIGRCHVGANGSAKPGDAKPGTPSQAKDQRGVSAQPLGAKR